MLSPSEARVCYRFSSIFFKVGVLSSFIEVLLSGLAGDLIFPVVFRSMGFLPVL